MPAAPSRPTPDPGITRRQQHVWADRERFAHLVELVDQLAVEHVDNHDEWISESFSK
jgi:hypothetical protein